MRNSAGGVQRGQGRASSISHVCLLSQPTPTPYPGRNANTLITTYFGGFLDRIRLAVVTGCAGRAGRVTAAGSDVLVDGRGPPVWAGGLLFTTATKCRHLLVKRERQGQRLLPGGPTLTGNANKRTLILSQSHLVLVKRLLGLHPGQFKAGSKLSGVLTSSLWEKTGIASSVPWFLPR